MVTLLKDLSYGIRMLAKSPGFTLVAVLSLALGIGANTTVFSLLDAVLLRSLPIENPERMVNIATLVKGGEPHFDFSYPLYSGLRDGNQTLSGIVAYTDRNLGLTFGDQTERIRSELVSANYFSVLGVQPAMGSAFAPDDERPGAARAAVISDALWHRRLAGDPGVLGKTITLNGRTFSVAGIAPRRFSGLLRGMQTDVWITLPHLADFEGNPKLMSAPTMIWLRLAGKLKPDTTIQQAQSQLTSLLPGVSQEAWKGFPYVAARENGTWQVVMTKAAGGNEVYVAELYRPLTMLLLAVALILAIACANVASLLLARARVRGKEIGIRLALGASRPRIVRQLLTESLLLALAGGALGLLMALWTSGLAAGLRTSETGELGIDVSPNIRVLLFTLIVSVLTVLLFGIVPALRASKVDLVPILKDSNAATPIFRRGPSLHGLLVVTQVTLSLVLLAGAGLFLRSLWKLQAVEKGFTGDNVLAMSLNMELQGYDGARGATFYPAALESLSSLPGVQSASLASVLPVTAGGSRIQMPANATKPAVDEEISIDIVTVSPRFFETTGLLLLRGRDFRQIDTEKSAKVMIVNETMAKKLWPDTDPLGRSFYDGDTTFEVVGVARNTKYRNLRETPLMTFYLPLAQSYRPSMNLLVRTAGEPSQLAPAIQGRLHAIEPALTVFDIRTLFEHVGRSLYVERMEGLLLTFFGILALTLTAIGIYGVVAYSVAQRTREVGIRMALGAQKKDVLKMILAQGLALVAWGTALGLIVCYWLSRLVSSQLYGVNAYDPATLASVVVVIIVVALLAAYIPARRATKVDPLVALRYE
ncbi:MAG: ABC transporter permease [Acidobacteriota bacterium]|nr:ABC transporter permease [Acidobacteriota bacterium]